MPDIVSQLAKSIHGRLKEIGCECPSQHVLKTLLESVYHATLRTEEGRFVRGSVTFMQPKPSPEDGPATRRANYPNHWPFGRPFPLTVERLAKLSRAIDMWSGSIAVYGTNSRNLEIWGVIDQLVQSNVHLNLEEKSSFGFPGVAYITMDGVGDLTVYHKGVFLGGLRGHKVLKREEDVLCTAIIEKRIWTHLERPAKAIRKIVGAKNLPKAELLDSWADTLYRICIGIRRYGTGGTLIITPSAQGDQLDIGYKFNYRRLGDSAILRVLDEEYARLCHDELHDDFLQEVVRYIDVLDSQLAETDSADRRIELTSAVKLVSSLASVDGAVLLSPLLHAQGFGVKIKTGGRAGTVYDGRDFARRGTSAKKINAARYGTRHNSVLQYCRADKNAIGIVVSQDGNVRIVTSSGRSLVMWDNVKLLGYQNFSRETVQMLQDWVKNHERRSKPRLGYTDTPKTLKELLHILDD